MKAFSFARFVTLLARVLEGGVVAALALRWIDALVAIWSDIALPGAAVETALNFSFFAIVLLLAADLWLLLTRQPRAVSAALRTLVYIVVFMLSPYRLGGSPQRVAIRPNQSMQPTAGRFEADVSHDINTSIAD
jgi:hypothetical protein